MLVNASAGANATGGNETNSSSEEAVVMETPTPWARMETAAHMREVASHNVVEAEELRQTAEGLEVCAKLCVCSSCLVGFSGVF